MIGFPRSLGCGPVIYVYKKNEGGTWVVGEGDGFGNTIVREDVVSSSEE